MNVILLVIDTLRADHLGCYGYGRATSPNLDRLARLLEDPAVNAFLADLVDEGMVESDGPLPASPAPSPAADVPAAPRIEWREEVRRFAGECGLLPGAGGLCNTQPTNS